MGKSAHGTKTLHQIVTITSKRLKSPKPFKPTSQNQRSFEELKQPRRKSMEGSSGKENGGNTSGGNSRLPLAEVVSDCVKRWFKDTLKEAKAGDISMQVLVSQMYFSGYGVARDATKGRIWMTRASRTRSSVWKVSDKRPGYNASDSDSDE